MGGREDVKRENVKRRAAHGPWDQPPLRISARQPLGVPPRAVVDGGNFPGIALIRGFEAAGEALSGVWPDPVFGSNLSESWGGLASRFIEPAQDGDADAERGKVLSSEC